VSYGVAWLGGQSPPATQALAYEMAPLVCDMIDCCTFKAGKQASIHGLQADCSEFPSLTSFLGMKFYLFAFSNRERERQGGRVGDEGIWAEKLNEFELAPVGKGCCVAFQQSSLPFRLIVLSEWQPIYRLVEIMGRRS